MKNWPKTVEIGGLKYKIYYVTPGKNVNQLAEKEAGAIIQCQQEIFIDKTLPPELKLLVLLHEILHGLGDAILPNGPPFKDEKFTNMASNLLLQALKSADLLKAPD